MSQARLDPAPGGAGRAPRLWIVSPIYFDVEAYTLLLARLRAVTFALPSQPPLAVSFVAVDDSAGLDPEVRTLEGLPGVRVIVPPFNLGHQRALVHGLRRLAAEIDDADLVVTADADGEDQPEDLPRLLAELLAEPGNQRRIALAARTRRRETLAFKVLYFFFKHFFLLLSGTVVRSGNFAAYRGWVARNVLFHPHFELCYASSLLSLNLNIVRVPCERGARYAGVSKMTYGKLVLHGLRMLMPFGDQIAGRGFVLSAFLLALDVLALVATALASLWSGAAIPVPWACALLAGFALSWVSLLASVVLFALFSQSQALSMDRLREGARAQ